MACEGRNVTLPCPRVDDLFSVAHESLLTGDSHTQKEEGSKESNSDAIVKERKRKRKKERIRHICRIDSNVDIYLHALPSPTLKNERLSSRTSTASPAGEEKIPLPTSPVSYPNIPPLLPFTHDSPRPPPASPTPPPRPHYHIHTPTPPPSSPTPHSPPIALPPSATRLFSSPTFSPYTSTHTTPMASPPVSPPIARPCITPTMEETEVEIRRKKKICKVCGDVARSLHFGGRACDSCKAFFRRAVIGHAFTGFSCVRTQGGGGGGDGGDGGGGGENLCVVTVKSRKECQSCRFVACLKAGMEVSLAAREDLSSLGMTPAPLGVYRLHAHHAHTKAPYLAGCWRPPPPHAPATPVLTPRYKEELLACCPAVGDAATLARLAASTPIATPLVLGYTHTLPQDTTLMYAHPPTDLHRVAPDMGTAFGQESMGHESSLTAAHTHAHTLTHTHQEVPAPHGHAPRRGHAPRSRRAPGHTHAITHPADTAHGLDTTQERGSSRLSPMPARQAPSGDPRTTKWPGKSLHRRAPNDPSTPWRPDPAVVDRGARQTACVAPCQDALSARDLAEITQLQQSYQGNMDAMAGPLEEQVPRGELEQLYTWFIERRAKFLVSTPLYTTVAAADRPKLLHVAVAMSTYITGAHHMDTADFSWRQRRGAGREVAVLSASSVRQLLSHQQFLHVMKFYTTYGEALADQTVAILMQVMSLFYPEEGLHAPAPVEEGRLHYLGLLSRYLAVSQGPREAACCLATLLTSQQEAHQLVQLLRQVDLKPWVPRTELATSRDMLAHRIHLVCEAARARPCPEATTPPPWPRQAPEGTVEHMGRIVSLLARCEDPRTLALARRILPKPLLHRFLNLLLCPHAPTRPPHPPTPPSPSPQWYQPGLMRHLGEPPPGPPALHLLPTTCLQ